MTWTWTRRRGDRKPPPPTEHAYRLTIEMRTAAPIHPNLAPIDLADTVTPLLFDLEPGASVVLDKIHFAGVDDEYWAALRAAYDRPRDLDRG